MRTNWLMAPLIVTWLAVSPAAAQSGDASQPPPNAGGQGDTTTGKEVHPLPTSTGWGTLFKDTVADFKAFPKRKSTWTLLAIGAGGAFVAHEAGDGYVERHIVGNSKADNFFKLGKVVGNTGFQVGAAVGLYGVGRYIVPHTADEPRTNKISHLGFDLLRAQMVAGALVHSMKEIGQRDRPTGECCSFPSGHAASAFAAAAVLERHLGYRLSWPALAGATYVATSRLVDNRHFLSDVIMGAAIGEASGWTVVGRHGRKSFAMQPVPVRGGIMMSFSRVAHDPDDVN
jgi:membrane-associated phospholipid phosphatase